MTFSRSIGGSVASTAINSSSIARSRSSGNPIVGYQPSQTWGNQGAPAPEHGAAQHTGGAQRQFGQRKSPRADVGSVNMANGKTKPSRTER